MKPINFFKINYAGKAHFSNLARSRKIKKPSKGINFSEITLEKAVSIPESSVRFSGIEEVWDKSKDGDSIDELFSKTMKQFEKTSETDSKAKAQFNSSAQDDVVQKKLGERKESDFIEKATPNLTEPIPASENKTRKAKNDKNVIPRVMLVEDDNIISGFIVHLLERRGFDVALAIDGREATKMMNEIDPPELIILDIMIPFVNGFGLITKIRDKKGWEDVPIMMLTSKTQERDVVRALDSGANDYIFKPFQSQELIARVDRFMR